MRPPTPESPKTSITAIAATLATAALVLWMVSFTARTDSLFIQRAHAPAPPASIASRATPD